MKLLTLLLVLAAQVLSAQDHVTTEAELKKRKKEANEKITSAVVQMAIPALAVTLNKVDGTLPPEGTRIVENAAYFVAGFGAKDMVTGIIDRREVKKEEKALRKAKRYQKTE